MPKFAEKKVRAGADFSRDRMVSTDVPDVAALEGRVFPDPWSSDSFLAEVERSPDIGYPFVLRDGSRLVAYAVVWFIVDELHVGNVAVDPLYQGRGIGTWVLEHILEEGRRRDLALATLEVRPSNEAARSLYDRFGFQQIAIRPRYYQNDGEDALVLALPLTNGEGRRG